MRPFGASPRDGAQPMPVTRTAVLALLALATACAGKKKDEAAPAGDVPTGGVAVAVAAPAAPDAVTLPLSTTREAYVVTEPSPGEPPRSIVTVSSDGIQCGGRTVAVIRTAADGRRTLEEAARTGGDESSFLPELRACLVAQRLDREELERRTGRAFADKDWLVVRADRATPMRIVQDVLYTSVEAERNRLQLLLRTKVADARGGLDPGSFGTVTLVPAGPVGSEGNRREAAGGRLRLTARVSSDSVTLSAARELAMDVLPEDVTTGTNGTVHIAHVTMTANDAEKELQTCRPPADPRAFNDCAYWSYMKTYLHECLGDPQTPAKVPDLKTFNVSLRSIADRAARMFGDQLDDAHVIAFQVEDDTPYCQVVALVDFARFRSFDFNWTADEAFSNGVAEAGAKGVRDPLLDPQTWNEAMTKELLFPIVEFLRWAE